METKNVMSAKRVDRSVRYFTDKNGISKYYVQVHLDNKIKYVPFDTKEEAIKYRDELDKQKQHVIVEKFRLRKQLFEYPYNLLHALEVTETEGNCVWFKKLVDNLLTEKRDVFKYCKDGREKTFLIEHFKDGKTLDEIGKDNDLTRERIRQIIAKGVMRIKEHINYIACDDEEIEQYRLDRIAEVEKEIDTLRNQMTIELAKIVLEESRKKLLNDIKDDDILTLGFSNRTRNALKRNGVKTVKQFINIEVDKIEYYRGVGYKGVKEIKEKLQKLGITTK
jgi:hypothetical protein